MHAKRKPPTTPVIPIPEEPEEDDISSLSESTWKSATSSQKSRNSSPASSNSSMNNNIDNIHPVPTTSANAVRRRHHSPSCHRHSQGQHSCHCIQNFYEDDEVCRKNSGGRLEFGIVGKYRDTDQLKVFWTLGDEIEEETINLDDIDENLRLIDRKAYPGDIIHVNKKRGEVLQVSYNCHVQIPETSTTLLNIPCNLLQPIVPYYTGQKIYSNGWVGTIINVSTEATLMFTGVARTGIMDCSYLPPNHNVNPGRNVVFTVNQYIEAKLKFIDDDRTVLQVFQDQVSVEAFVLFVNVTDVEVKWIGRINSVGKSKPQRSLSTTSTNQPPTVLTKSYLKKNAHMLGTISDIDWDSASDDITTKYFQYTAKDTDESVPTSTVEDYLKQQYFDEEIEGVVESCTVKDLRECGSEICTNVGYNVRVLRFSRMLQVKWTVSGKVDNIPASAVTAKTTFDKPFHQLVQKSVSLAPYSYDDFGITLTRDSNETVLVQWIGKVREHTSKRFKFVPTYQTPESAYDIEPHFAYGGISTRDIVYRSVYCRVPEPVFTVGWVRSINANGTVTIACAHTKQDHIVYPPEIEVTGMKIDDSPPDSKFKITRHSEMIRVHGITTLRNSEKLFVQNLSLQESRFPEHFTLIPKCPLSHSFYKSQFSVHTDGMWMRAVKKDQVFLTTRMNDDIGSIWVKGFRDRLDLFSVLMAAPQGSPYEGALYSIDLQLVPEYPHRPPSIYLHTKVGMLKPGITHLDINDNMKSSHSLVDTLTLLQAKLFATSDYMDIPSSAASLHRRTSKLDKNNERLQNATIIIEVLDLIYRSVMDPPPLWSVEMINYFQMTFERTKQRLNGLVDLGSPFPSSTNDWVIPSFPLMPVSDGFSESVLGRLKRFDELIERGVV